MATSDTLRTHSGWLPSWAAYPLAAALVVAAVTGLAIHRPLPSPPPIPGKTVLIEFKGGIGSGVYIGDGFYLTAAHVATSADTLTIKTDTGAAFVAPMLWAAKEYDVALLKVDKPIEQHAAALSCVRATLGQKVFLEGNPEGFTFIRTSGHIASMQATVSASDGGTIPWTASQVVDGVILPGMSGGPALDTYGRLIGINVGVMTDTGRSQLGPVYTTTGLGFIVPSSAICRLLARGNV